MCAEKAQRLLMSAVIALGTALLYFGHPAGVFVLGFVVVMAAVWGVVDFCPSLWGLRRIGVPGCYRSRGPGRA